MTHDEVVAFARKHKESLSLDPHTIKEELRALNKKFEKDHPNMAMVQAKPSMHSSDRIRSLEDKVFSLERKHSALIKQLEAVFGTPEQAIAKQKFPAVAPVIYGGSHLDN